MVNSKELTIGAWVRSSKDIAQVTALYKEEDGIHVEGNLFCADDPSPEDVVTLIPDEERMGKNLNQSHHVHSSFAWRQQ